MCGDKVLEGIGLVGGVGVLCDRLGEHGDPEIFFKYIMMNDFLINQVIGLVYFLYLALKDHDKFRL